MPLPHSTPRGPRVFRPPEEGARHALGSRLAPLSGSTLLKRGTCLGLPLQRHRRSSGVLHHLVVPAEMPLAMILGRTRRSRKGLTRQRRPRCRRLGNLPRTTARRRKSRRPRTIRSPMPHGVRRSALWFTMVISVSTLTNDEELQRPAPHNVTQGSDRAVRHPDVVANTVGTSTPRCAPLGGANHRTIMDRMIACRRRR